MSELSNFHTVRGYKTLENSENSLTSAMEDYLEMIYRNSGDNGHIRINTLSELLNVAAPSATKMVQNLSRIGLVVYKKYDFVVLTEKGREIGENLLKRHLIIEKFLKNIGVEDELLIDTELIEHDMSERTVKKIDMLNKFIEFNPDIIKKYKVFMQINSD